MTHAAPGMPSEIAVRFDDLVTGTAFTLAEPVEVIKASLPAEVAPVLRAAEQAARSGRHVAGFVSYEAARGLDASLAVADWPRDLSPTDPPPADLPLAWFGVFAERHAIAPIDADDSSVDDPTPPRWSLRRERTWHAAAVAAIRAGIELGEYYQVNLTAGLTSDTAGSDALLYERMATAQRGRYNALIRTGDFDIVSCSPELFFELTGSTITTRPMKGTTRRGRWPSEDDARAGTLRASAKERAENLMIVDLIRNDLARVAEIGTVAVPALFTAERYPTVWQLTSTVTATLRPNVDLADLFTALFPSGSVTGAPKAAAMQAIADIEAEPRGVYCGAIGWLQPQVDARPRAQFSVAIRTATRRCGRATYGAGGGITWSSTPDAEWNELLAKTEVLTIAPAPSGLLETLRYEPAHGTVHLDRHLERMERSATHFAVPFDRHVAVAAVEAAVSERASAGRLRIVVTATGDISAAVDEISPMPATVRLAVAADPVDSHDRLLFHKQLDRRRYDLARSAQRHVDDVILHNERGEVTETTTSNIAILVSGTWRTPAVDCGLLAGVQRGLLLEAGELVEHHIPLADLAAADAVAVFNSLRGWRQARIVPSANPGGPAGLGDVRELDHM